ncbi:MULTISPECIES: right-handed parallel beta-helix repeat-containing protein [Gammaproteobacteria]|nr:right-handed parallel beta-helix repeat-containing protein [Klebsiella grimontii]EGT0066953.1 right-handed parallel beta-helix repeat-containing protein [Klebsiella michiganensis]RDA97519.1 right-handed parallel beta-helix repeat-containing protein [Klebsiella oxytoca]MBS6572555.1 right-handed parallel beta-helix repeat-containing protein [Klebsiella michiganensis]MCG2854408.1 right-handed parallel beta-helix repeat-containing protein [Klebsiella grimontii]MDU4226643.1 right-handed parallel
MKRRSFILSALSMLSLFSFDLKASYHTLELDIRDNNLKLLKSRIYKDKMELKLLLSQLMHKTKKVLKVDKLYYLDESVTLPDGCDVIGTGKNSGFVFVSEGRPESKYGLVIRNSNNKLENFGLYFTSSHNVSNDIGKPDFICIFITETASNCSLNNLFVENYTPNLFFFSHCVRVMGSNHSINNCSIINGSMCLSIRGQDITVLNNHITNNFSARVKGPWRQSCDVWDGIVMEGCKQCSIIGNVIYDCGQSGIYCGGNGSASSNISIIKNTVYKNWNRGIDIGVTGKVTEKNFVKNVLIKENIVFDNREPQIWLNGVSGSEVSHNIVSITLNYKKFYRGYYGGIVGIALGSDSRTENNSVILNEVNVMPESVAAITVYGRGNSVRDNNIKGRGVWYDKKSNVLSHNIVINNVLTK